ncbi:hypothetical protein ABZS61_28605 [Streptomyces sp. NPDC005566]|uniref:dTMP kinase n=1 Tax=Streptomyces sp. NPDC005566 TaxID=3156886 RepID=UPI0033BB0E17
MLIAIEGIDGSGKSTLAPILAEHLSLKPGQQRGDKKSVTAADKATAERAAALRDLIWASDETSGDTFGATHWILLIASWYASLARLRPDLAPDAPGVTVMDGWYYRNVAKTLIREPFDPQWVWSLFAPAPQPALVVLLDVEPATAWERRAQFKDTELGRWDGFTGPAREAFCGYQQLIRRHLLAMADQHDWLVIRPETGTGPRDTAHAIAAHVRATRP